MKKEVSKEDLNNAPYILGIIAIVLAFVQPLVGLILGIIGLNMAKKNKGNLAENAKKLNKYAIIIAIIVLILLILLVIFLPGLYPIYQETGGTFPIQ